jgi:hypothetical protein
MAMSPREPVLDFIPDYPRNESLRKAWSRWWRETWWFLRHTLTPVEKELPAPVREVTLPDPPLAADALKESLESMRKLVDSAESRAALLRTKASSLLGIVALVTPLVSWWLVSGRDRLAAASPWLALLAYVLMALTAISLALALFAMFRTQRVVTYSSLSLDHLVDLQTGHLKVKDPATEVRKLASVWGGIERWSDMFADYVRAGQRFLGLSLVFAITAGSIAYLHPDPKQTANTVIQVTGNPAVQTGAASISVAQPSSASDVLLTIFISILAGAGIVLLTIYCYRKFP